jgi:iron complex outermembrane receptor protein
MIGSSIGYNHAEYSEFEGGQCTVNQAFTKHYIEVCLSGAPGTTGSCSVDLEGKPLDNAPEWTVSTYVQYEHELGENLMGKVRLEHNYIDSFFLDQDLDQNLFNEEVDLVHRRFTLYTANRDWEVAVWGQNLLDEEYYAMGIDIPTVGGYAGVTAPGALYGLTLRYNFY